MFFFRIACDCPKGDLQRNPPIFPQHCHDETGECYCRGPINGIEYSETPRGCEEASKQNDFFTILPQSFLFSFFHICRREKLESFQQGTKTNAKLLNGTSSQNLVLLNMLRAETVNSTEKLTTKMEVEGEYPAFKTHVDAFFFYNFRRKSMRK